MVTMQTNQLRDAETAVRTRLPEQRGRAAVREVRPQPPAVLVVDSDERMESRLRTALGGPPVLRAQSLADALRLTSALGAGALAVVNLTRVGPAADVIRGLRAAGWHRVLVLTDRGTEVNQVLAAFDAGAGGVVSIPDRGPRRPHPLDVPFRLSRREVEVVRLVADGLSNKAIGQQLSLSALTVKNHLARVGRKLGTGDRAHIVAIACRQGMIFADT